MITERYVDSRSGVFWYGRAGEFAKTETPLVLVHGGPGFTSHYFEPLLPLAAHLPVVFWDQAGCGRSRLKGPRRDFSIEGFSEELEVLRSSLGVDRMHLLGHSFGGVIIGEYTLRYPMHVATANFVSASLDVAQWRVDAARLRALLPLMSRMVLTEGDRTGNYLSPQYLAALAEYNERFIYRFKVKPDCIIRSERESDPATYVAVWGPNELVITGVAKDYSILSRLHQITVPTAFMCGRYDEATPEAHTLFASKIPGSRLVVFEESAHHPQINETERFIGEVWGFIEEHRALRDTLNKSLC